MEFGINICVWGHHASKAFCPPTLEEELLCEHENGENTCNWQILIRELLHNPPICQINSLSVFLPHSSTFTYSTSCLNGLTTCTVEPLNNGHTWGESLVLCRKVLRISEVFCIILQSSRQQNKEKTMQYMYSRCRQESDGLF